MKVIDTLRFTLDTFNGYRLRTSLMLLAMAIGVAAVVILTSLGEAARRYVTAEFSSLGTHLLIVLPGRSETAGVGPSLFMGETPRDLTLDDAEALTRSGFVRRSAPLVIGSAHASWQGREREVPIMGTSSDFIDIRHWTIGQGKFLPDTELNRATPVCVIGSKIRDELFGAQRALGEWLRLGDRRFRVIGILDTEGRSIGIDAQETVFIPVASAQMLLNVPSLFRILVEARSREAIPSTRDFILSTIRERHQGEEDITVVTQDAVLATFDRIFQALTMTVGGIAAISLGVAGILIMNVMLVSVSQRTAEIGLLKAIGASGHQIVLLFISEAAVLSAVGAGIGLTVGQLGSWIIGTIYPALTMGAPWWAILAATVVALLTGLVFGAMPARRAARLDPVTALSTR